MNRRASLVIIAGAAVVVCTALVLRHGDRPAIGDAATFLKCGAVGCKMWSEPHKQMTILAPGKTISEVQTLLVTELNAGVKDLRLRWKSHSFRIRDRGRKPTSRSVEKTELIREALSPRGDIGVTRLELATSSSQN